MLFSRSFCTNIIRKSPVKLSYTLYDNNVTPNKSPIVIMHGLFGSKSNWNTLSKSLNQQTQRKIIAIDARNHGSSPHTPVMTYGSMASDVNELLNDLGHDKSILIGHSMGGAAMMYTALRYPSAVDKLIVVDMSPIKTSPSLHQMTDIINAMIATDFSNIKNISEARKKIDIYLAKTIDSPGIRQFLVTNIIEDNGVFKWRVNLPVISQYFSTHIAQFPTEIINNKNELSSSFDGKTLFIGGSKSDYIRIEDHEKINKLFTNCRIEYVEGAGHWVQSDNPAKFLELSNEFINET